MVSKYGTKSPLLGRIYEIAVKTTRHVSPIISGLFFKNFVYWASYINSGLSFEGSLSCDNEN